MRRLRLQCKLKNRLSTIYFRFKNYRLPIGLWCLGRDADLTSYTQGQLLGKVVVLTKNKPKKLYKLFIIRWLVLPFMQNQSLVTGDKTHDLSFYLSYGNTLKADNNMFYIIN